MGMLLAFAFFAVVDIDKLKIKIHSFFDSKLIIWLSF